MARKQESTGKIKEKKVGLSHSKKRRNIVVGVINVMSTFNNTIVSIADTQGNIVAWASSGKMGFKGSRKSTPYAAQVVMTGAIEKAKEFGLQTANVVVRGAGSGRESALRALQGSGISVIAITDGTYYPHNGCRPPKRRRM
ncbi:MAG: 30S ribosomal protein S11 [Rickettsiales bacterium]|jgi:small subunit ribosomal protein S11|nr:30S ribosomal protein S11 [Rickettsiales bacterium]